MILTDRSRIIAAQTCPRKRYLEYHVHGSGLQRKSKSLPLQFGSAFHIGAEFLLAGDVEKAVTAATDYLKEVFVGRGVGLDGEDNQTDAALTYAAEEQMALAEGLIRAWGLHSLPRFLETFEVIEVEREGRATLSQHPEQTCPNCESSVHAGDSYCPRCRHAISSKWRSVDDLVLMFRPDALLRDKASGDLYVASWKTTSYYGKRNMAQAKVDMQSISEVWGWQNSNGVGVEARDARDWGKKVHVEGVYYIWIVKGLRKLDKWDSLYKQQTPLVYGWRKVNSDGIDDWSHSFSYDKEDGSGESKLGKGWKKVPIWREYPGGIKQWITDLHSQSIFPRHINALDSIFPESLPVERRQDEVESWKRQVVAQELKVARDVESLSNWDSSPELFKEFLDERFPQYTHSCSAYSGCAYQDICWNGVPAEPGELYQIRSANHPEKGDGDE